MTDHTVIRAEVIRPFLAGVFERLGVPAGDAGGAADVLVRADLRGVETHGVINLYQYLEPLREGTLNPRPNITLARETPITAVMDGDGGMGLVVGVRGMELAIAKAKQHGMGAVTVRRSRHFGMASYFGLMCLPHDMIGIAMTNNSGVGIVPTFGRQPMMSTNPLSIVAPAGSEPPFELDMATSVAAMGKVDLARKTGKKIPFGWCLDAEGRPTDDPQVAWDAARILPLGGTRELGSHKGYGLAVAVDILTGLLAGGPYGNVAQRNPPADPKLRVSSSHFCAALRVDYFRPLDEFKADMDDMLRALKESEKAEGHDRIYTAGEIEYETERERLANGIPYHRHFVGELQALAREFSLPLEV